MEEPKENSVQGSSATEVPAEIPGNPDVVDNTNATSITSLSPRNSEANTKIPAAVENLSEKAAQASRRPVTRSLSGRSAKRRILQDNFHDGSSDDAASHASEAAPASKRQKITRRTRKSAAADVPAQDSSQPHVAGLNSQSPSLTENNNADGSSESASSSTVPTGSASISTAPLIATRIGTKRAMRATLPTPVPNLTKKSRGRRVPVRVITTTGAEIITDPVPPTGNTTPTTPSSTPKEKRSYVCSVEGCGKCFYRGEHLKRHIRSIHTHEKPFKCTYPECDKHFNRHDNLLQHLKVHKQAQATAAMTASGGPVVLLPTGKTKTKGKSKGKGSKSTKNYSGSRGRGNRRRASSEEEDDEDDGNGSADEDNSGGSASSDAGEQDAVSNLLSLRAPLKGAPTLITPLHHTLTSSYAPPLSSLGSISSTATLVGSGPDWGHHHSGSTSTSGFPGAKPYISPFAPSLHVAPHHHSDTHSKSYNPHIHTAHGQGHHLSSSGQFSLSKAAYSSGATSYESSATDVLQHSPNGYHGHGHGHGHVLGHGHGHGHEMDDETFQYNMAMSSLRSTTSTTSTLRSTNGNGNGKKDIDGPNGSIETSRNGDGSNGREHGLTKDMFIGAGAGAGPNGLGYAQPPAHSHANGNGNVVTDPAAGNSHSARGHHHPHHPHRTGSAGFLPSMASSANGPNGNGNGMTMQSLEPRITLRPVGSEQDWRA